MASNVSDKDLNWGFSGGDQRRGATTTTHRSFKTIVQESPMTSIAGNEALTELEVKLQEQLHYANEENNLLKRCLEEKEQKLSVLRVLRIKMTLCWKRSFVKIIS